MAKIYRTKDINEAFKLAEKFQRSGKYNLFRGQAKDWKVIPTAGRLSKEEFQESKAQLERLFYYFNSETSLKKYCKGIDDFFAIAQHYGIPTNYIDFSERIDVAFHFATNSQSNKPLENCSIICLNEKDFSEFVEFTKILFDKNKVIPPYIIKKNIENLWRLQAQSGCFLFTPYYQIESFYDFDRILFPFSSPFNKISKQDIYPNRKSELEIMLDLYFNKERRLNQSKKFQAFLKEFDIPVKEITPNNPFEILNNKKVHTSWYSSTYKKWNFRLNEKWQPSQYKKEVKLNIPLKLSKKEAFQSIKATLKEQFENSKVNRKTPLSFDILTRPELSVKKTYIIKRSCERIWDGTRNLPYTDMEIFAIISNYLLLEFYDQKVKQGFKDDEDNLITLEMTNKYGSSTRFKAVPNNIIKAYRDDLDEIIVKYPIRPIPIELLFHINRPRYIFDFKKLIELFKKEIVANQVFENRLDNHPVIFYSPAQVRLLGYA
jgi:hypothetical protein